MANIKRTVFNFLGIFDAVRTINDKYKHPRIKMTPLVKISLLILRIYLFFMIVILLFKFIQLLALN
jgi:hypothetical protein